MKATELRIGNFVTIDNEEFHPEIKNVPLEVTQILQCESLIRGIWTHSVSLEFINKKKNVYYEDFGQFIKYIEPIPLTEEWLLKFGFEKAKHSHGYNCYIKDGFDFDIVSHGRYWVFAIYTDESCTNSLYFAHNRFEYVHQFQNLYFALTGEELILNEKL